MPPQSARDRLEELRNQQTQGGQTAAERLALLRAMDAGVDTSPFELPPIRTEAFPTNRGQRTAPRYPAAIVAAANNGVDVTTGAPSGRLKAAFGGNDAERAAAISESLSSHFDAEVTVRMGPESRQIEYLNPETRRWTLVDEISNRPNVRDVAEALPTAIPIAGGVVGEIIGGPPGAALGAGSGEAVRRSIGNLIGVRDESAGDIAKGAAGIGLLEGTFAAAGNLVARVPAAVRRFFRPEVVSADYAQATLLRMEATQAVADEISERTGLAFRPFTGQLADDQLMLSEQASLRGSRTEGIGRAINDQEAANKTALERYFDVVTPQGGGDPSIVGGSIQNEARRISQPVSDSVRDTISRQVAELEMLTAQLANAPDETAGRAIRQRIQQLRDVFAAHEDALWDDVRAAYGFNPDTALSDVRIPVSGDLERQIRRLRVEAKEALDPAIATGKRQLTSERLLPNSAELSPDDMELLQAFGVGFEETHSVDLHQLQVLTSFLGRRERIALEGVVATDPAGADIIRMRRSLLQQRNEYLAEHDPELLIKIQEAEAITAERASTFDEMLAGDILRRGAGNRYAISNSDVVARTIASRDPESLRHLMAIMSDNPAGIPTLQQAMLAYYRNEVVRNGIPDRQLHDAFMRRNAEAVDVVFAGDSTRVRRLGEFARVVENNVKRLENFEKAVARRFEGRIQGVAPERVVEAVFNTQFSAKDAMELMRLADASGYSNLYRRAVGDQLSNRFVTPGTGIRVDALQRFLSDEGPKLKAIMGPQYVSNLETLLEAARISLRRSNANVPVRSSAETVIDMLARPTIAPPLSARGRGLTGIFRFRERARERAWATIISDPQTLNAVILRSNMDASSRQAGELFGVIGASAVIMQMREN